MRPSKLIIKILTVLLLLPFLIFQVRDGSNRLKFDTVPGSSLKGVRVKIHNNKSSYILKDSGYVANESPDITDLILSFDKKSRSLNKDETKNYNISSADYIFSRDKGAIGKGCGLFYKRNHSVKISTSNNLWLGRCGDLGSFSIEFRFKALSLRDGSLFFSRIGYSSGIKNGIEIGLRNRKVTVSLHNFFHLPDGRKKSVILYRGKSIIKGKWYHFLLSYNRVSGHLAKYINGVEDESKYITLDKTPYNGPYLPSFGAQLSNEGEFKCVELPVAEIGKNYSGLIDEFKISEKSIKDLKQYIKLATTRYNRAGLSGFVPYNITGVIMSPVYKLHGTGTKVTLFAWQEILKKRSFAWFQFRISDDLFKKNNSSLKWYRIKNNQRKIYLKKLSDDSYLRGKYLQWKAHLVPSPHGKNSPEISNIRINYILDKAPVTPRFLEVIGKGDRYITVRWKKNVEHDILGYKIYYGINSNVYDGVIKHYRGKRITNSISSGKYIKIKIDNSLVNKSRKQDKRKLLSYPVIRNNLLYFIAVSAYDSYRPDTKYNHESPISREVNSRPFAGSEID